MANGRFRRAQRGTTNQIVLLAASSGLSRRSNDMRRRASALTWMHSSASRLRSGRRIHRPRCPQSQLRGIVNVNHVSSDFEVTESSPGRLCRSIGRGALWRFCLKYLPKTRVSAHRSCGELPELLMLTTFGIPVFRRCTRTAVGSDLNRLLKLIKALHTRIGQNECQLKQSGQLRSIRIGFVSERTAASKARSLLMPALILA